MFAFTTFFTTLAVASSLAAASNWDITVGGAAGLVFTPPSVHPAVGDTLTFHFSFKNHSVTQGSFDNPCTPLNFGINSGFVPVALNATELPIFVVTVQDKKPIFFHCEQTGHCPGSGMVFAANADDQTFAKYQAKAIALGPVAAMAMTTTPATSTTTTTSPRSTTSSATSTTSTTTTSTTSSLSSTSTSSTPTASTTTTTTTTSPASSTTSATPTSTTSGTTTTTTTTTSGLSSTTTSTTSGLSSTTTTSGLSSTTTTSAASTTSSTTTTSATSATPSVAAEKSPSSGGYKRGYPIRARRFADVE